MNSDSFEKRKRQSLKRRLLQCQWLQEKGINCSIQLEELKKEIVNEGYSLGEIEGEEIKWRFNGRSRETNQ